MELLERLWLNEIGYLEGSIKVGSAPQSLQHRKWGVVTRRLLKEVIHGDKVSSSSYDRVV